MTFYEWDDPRVERQAVNRAKARRDRIALYRATTPPSQAHGVAQIAAAYPAMSRGVAVPLGLSGASPDDPMVNKIAVSEARHNRRKRGFWGAIGDTVGGALDFGVDRLEDIGGLAAGVARTGSRYGMAALSAVPEEAMGVVRNLAASGGNIVAGAAGGALTGATVGLAGGPLAPISVLAGIAGGAVVGGVAGAATQMKGLEVEGEAQWRPQSAFGVHVTGGGGLGQGYLPGGTATKEATRRARESAMIGSHAFTPGRFLAAAVFDEDTTPYRILSGVVDASNAWKLDPAAALGTKVSRVRKEVSAFERTGWFGRSTADARLAAGLVDNGHRPGIISENATAWLNGRQGTQAKEILAGTDDFETVRRNLGRDVEPSTVLALLDARTPEDVDDVLRGKLGLSRGLETKPRITGVRERARRVKDDFRFLQDMPTKGINFSRPAEAIDQFALLQHSAKLPYETISRNNEQLARALQTGDIERARAVVVKDFVAGADGVLVRNGVHSDLAKRMGDVWHGVPEQIRRDLMDDIGNGVEVPAVTINGEAAQIASPGPMLDVLENFVDFDPDEIRNLRRITSRYKSVVANPVFAGAVDVAAQITNKVWKVPTLLRGAYFTRVIGDEQLRLGVDANDSVFSHPLSYMAWVAADDGKIGRIFQKFGGKAGRGDIDVIGRAFNEAPIEVERALRGEMNNFADALGRDAQRRGWLEGGLVKGRHRTDWRRGEEHYAKALTEKIDRLHRDPVVRSLADPRRSAVRDAPQWPWDPASLMRDPDIGPSIQAFAALSGRRGAPLATTGGRIPDPDVVRRWLSNTMRQAQDTAAGDTRLWDTLATGEIDGIPLRLPNGQLNKEFTARVRQLTDQGIGPESVVGSRYELGNVADRYNRVVEGAFSFVMGDRTATLSRSVAFKQDYWTRQVRSLITEATPEAQRRILDNAAAARLPKDLLDDLAKRAKVSQGDLSLDEIDLLAGGRATDYTKKLLYDASRKGNLSDIMRVVFPFMEAHKESLVTWSRLALNNPQVARRVGQVFTAARGSGVFYKDPQTGEEMFAYPGSRFFTDKFFGTPIALGNRVEGLSMFGSGIMPGFGPVAQISARWFLPDTPQFDQVREMVDPFGESAQGGMLEQFGPGWLRAMVTGFNMDDSDRAFGNDVMDVFNVGLTTGEYSNGTADDIRDGLESAKQKARWLHVLRGGSMLLGAPSPPRPEFVAQDPDGRWVMMDSLVKEYRKVWEKHPEDANEQFLAKYGLEIFALVQPSTYAGGKILPESTTAAGDWARNNPGIAERYPAIYGLFAPRDETADFDINVWARQVRTDERIPMEPDQRVKFNNDKIAKTVYYNARNRFGPFPNQAQRKYLSQLNDTLVTEFPGYQQNLGLPEKVDTEQRIVEIQQAVEDPDLADNPVTEATRVYLALREQMNTAVAQAGIAQSSAKAKGAAPARAYLRQVAEALVARYPEFGEVWDRVFEPELIDDSAVPEEEVVSA